MAKPLSVGDTYGEFQIQGLLRSYPHAHVYRAQGPGFGEVALKLSIDPVVSEQTARRALREVAVLQALTSDHVIKVHDSGLGPDDHWYIVMENPPGAQLNHWHDFDRPLPATDAVSFIHQACLGLAEVHAAGVVHRDLKPERLWVTPSRTVKLLDFSSARSWGEGATGDNVTVGIQAVGSPEYAAPEQAFSSELNPRADVYSLGVMLYEMLSGRSPVFPAMTWSQARAHNADDPGAWMRAHARRAPTSLAEHAAGLPARLVALVDSTLAKDPASRPENAAELANGLGWVLHHDLGAAQAAILKVAGEGRPRYHLVLPGSHRLGGGSEVDLPLGAGGPTGVAAVIEWAGAPKPAELLPAEGVQLNGAPVTERTSLVAEDAVTIGALTLSLSYPRR